MAEKLTVLYSQKDAYGGINRRILYFYDIPTNNLIKDNKGNTVAPQSQNDLPSDAALYLAQVDKDAISVGEAGFEIFNMYQTAGETDTAYKNRLLADHTARMSWWIQDKRDKYALAGYATSV